MRLHPGITELWKSGWRTSAAWISCLTSVKFHQLCYSMKSLDWLPVSPPLPTGVWPIRRCRWRDINMVETGKGGQHKSHFYIQADLNCLIYTTWFRLVPWKWGKVLSNKDKIQRLSFFFFSVGGCVVSTNTKCVFVCVLPPCRRLLVIILQPHAYHTWQGPEWWC